MSKKLFSVILILAGILTLIFTGILYFKSSDKSYSDYMNMYNESEVRNISDDIKTREEFNSYEKTEVNMILDYAEEHNISGELVAIDITNPESYIDCTMEFYDYAKQCSTVYVIYTADGSHNFCIHDNEIIHEFVAS